MQQIRDRSARRQVTVLFADLVNFTRAAENVDPEIIYRTIRNSLEQLAKIIRRLGGRVDRYYGDGFLATFGIPKAHEDDHLRALKAAIEMQDQMTTLQAQPRQELNWEMQLRIGINVGSVIKGNLDTGSIQDSSIFGHAVNLANRLQAAARPGTVLVSESVYLKSRSRFGFHDPVSLQLKGIDKVIVAYELKSQLSNPDPGRGLKGRSAPFIGRNYEYDQLVTGLEQLQLERRGLIALITGEAGIGKSRLVEEVLPTNSQTVKVVRGQGSPLDSSSYGFILNLLNQLKQIGLDNKIETGESFTNRTIEFQDRNSVNPQEHQRRIIAQTRNLISSIAKRHPLIMLFDDIQWIDKSSMEVVSHCIDLTKDLPLSLLFVARSSFLEKLPDYLSQEGHGSTDIYKHIHLRSLPSKECNLLVDTLLPEILLPFSLKDEIYQRSGGNPLFVEELIRSLLDEAEFQKTDHPRKLIDQWQESIKEIPTTVNGLLLNRYDRQPEELKIILDMASVIGQNFHIALLSSILNNPTTELQVHIDRLEQADLLRRSKGYSPTTCSFRHALLQEVIYDTILFEDRKLLHGKVAETLKFSADEYYSNPYAIIGYHLENCGSIEAIEFLLQAAIQAANHYANDEAISYYQRIQKLILPGEYQTATNIDVALGLGQVLVRVGKSDLAQAQLIRALDSTQTSPLSNYRLGDIHYLLGRAHYEQGMLHEALENFETARQLIEKFPKESQLFSQTDTEREIGWIFWQQGRLRKALTHAEKALSLAQKAEDLDAEGSAYKLLSSINYLHGQTKKSIEYGKKSLRIREQLGDIWKATSTQTTLGYFYHQIGQWPLAEQILRQAIYVQKEIGDYYLLASSWSNLGLLLLDKGTIDEALDCMNESLEIITRQDLPISMATVFYINRGIAHLRIEDLDLAYQDFEQALVSAKKQSNDEQSALAYAYFTETKVKLKELSAAEGFMQKAEGLIRSIESNEYLREVFRIKSYLKRKLGDFEAALKANREAKRIAQDESNRYESARLSIDQAKIILSRGNGADINNSNLHADVVQALDIFQDLEAETGISWAEEILFQIESLRSEIDDLPGITPEFLTSVIDIRINIPISIGSVEVSDEKVIKIQKMIATELNSTTNKPNVFLNATPAGFAFVLATINQPAIKERFAFEAVQLALFSLMALVRINKIIRTKYGSDLKTRIGVSIGSSEELIKNHEQAAMFSSIARLGRQATFLSENVPQFNILINGEIPRAIHDKYELSEFHIEKDRKHQPCFILGEAISPRITEQDIPQSTRKFIGRKEEFDTVKDVINQIKNEPKGQVIYIEAKAGMGKTRLLKEIKKISEVEIQYLHGKCEYFRRAISFWPLIDILDRTDDHPSEARNRLKSLLGLYLPDENDKLLLQNLPADSLRKEIFSRTSDFLKSQTDLGPVMWVIEDIHDIDLSTLDIIEYLFPIIFEAPISIMLIARAEMPGPHRSLVKKAKRICKNRFTHIELGELSRQDSHALVKDLLGSSTIPAKLIDFLEPFVGHPLSAEEITRYAIESGLLWRANDSWNMEINTEEQDKLMPVNFRDLLLKRLELLDHDSLHVLQAGALLGENFNQLILDRMITDSSLAQKLSELTNKRWLQKSSNGNPLLFMFNHTLTRETIYSTLVRSKKQLLHQRAGEAIEALFPESIDENLELLAYHFENSSLQDKSLHYLIRAAEKCAHNFALDESRGYFNKARIILIKRNLAQSRMMIRVSLGQADVYLNLGETDQAGDVLEALLESNDKMSNIFAAASYRRLGAAFHMHGDFDGALKHYNHAMELCSSDLSSHEQLGGNLIVSGDIENIEILIGKAKIYFDSGKYQKADEITQTLLNGLSNKKYHEKSAELFNLLAGIAFRKGDFESAHQLTEKGLACYRANNNRSKASSAYSNLGVLASLQQNFLAGGEYFSLALDIQSALGDASGISITSNNLGQLELNQGNITDAQKFLQHAVDTARRSEILRSLAQGLSNLGFVHVTSGDWESAIINLTEAKTLCNSHQYLDLLSENYWKLAEYYLAADDIANAENAADSALELAIEIENKDLEIHGMRSISRVLRMKGKIESALQMISKAWQLVQNDRDKVKVTRFASEYVLCLIENDQPEKAVDIVNEHIVNKYLLEPEYIRNELFSHFPYLKFLQLQEN